MPDSSLRGLAWSRIGRSVASEVLWPAAQGAAGLEPQTDLPRVQGHEGSIFGGPTAPPSQARTRGAVRAAVGRYGVVDRLHERRARLWPPFSDLQRGRRLRPRSAAHQVDTSITSARLVRIFEQIRRDHGLPQVLRSDKGAEFLGEAFTQWAMVSGVSIQYIQLGKPNQNAYIDRFNRTFREEVLDQHLIARLGDVREAAYWWMLDYNEQRPHESPGDLTPAEYRQQAASGSTFEVSA